MQLNISKGQVEFIQFYIICNVDDFEFSFLSLNFGSPILMLIIHIKFYFDLNSYWIDTEYFTKAMSKLWLDIMCIHSIQIILFIILNRAIP